MLGFRVMAFVQKAVARLYEPEKLETLLQDLGKKHFAYGAKQKYVDVSSSPWNVILILSTGNIKAFRISVNVISSSKQHFLCKCSISAYWQVVGNDNIVKLIQEIVFPPPKPPHVLSDFVVLPPGHGRIVTDF